VPALVRRVRASLDAARVAFSFNHDAIAVDVRTTPEATLESAVVCGLAATIGHYHFVRGQASAA